MPRQIIIDTDPGKDDAVAILLALARPDELDVLALTAVAGNVPLAWTESNARRILELGGRPDIPVYAGCAGPLVRSPLHAEHVHGASGLHGLILPDPASPCRPEHAVDALIDAIRVAAPNTVTLCLLGPATNLAMALVKAPEIAGRIQEVVWMAGARSEGGNVTPAAEFNVYADPEAARIVLASGVPLTLAPLDLTHQVQLTPARRELLLRLGTEAAGAVAALYADTPQHGREGAPLHDPCVIAHLLTPAFDGRLVNVAVETASPLTAGMTVVDWHGVTGRPPNARFLNQADPNAFFALLFAALKGLP